MGAQKTIQKRALSLVLAVIMAFGCTFITAPAGAQDVVDSDYVYVSTNLYKYNRTGMEINQAVINAANIENTKQQGAGGDKKSVRALSFDKAYITPNSNYGGFWNDFEANGGYDRNSIKPGLAANTLDANGNLQWAETNSYKYVTADLFGSTSADAKSYRTDYTNLSFPLKKEKDQGNYTGYYSFNSASQRAVLNTTTHELALRDQNIQTSVWNPRPQFSPFYSGEANDISSNSALTYSFGMDMNMKFIIPEHGTVDGTPTGTPMTFTFSGDDDVWVFVDGMLALDIGGIHQAKTGTIDFSTCKSGVETTPDKYKSWGPAATAMQDGGVHTLSIYYLERGNGDSNFYMKCNLPQASSFEVGKQLEGDRAVGDKGTYTFQAYYDSGVSRQEAYTALKNQGYSVYNINGGTFVKDSGTNGNGEFTLQSGQKAVFSYFKQTVKDTIPGKTIQVTEVGDVAEKYDTKWYTSIGQTTDHGDGKEAEITAPPDDQNSVQTASILFTNKLPSGITDPNKTANQIDPAKRTYDITLRTSTKQASTDPTYTLADRSEIADNTVYYLDEYGNGRIIRHTTAAVMAYKWSTSSTDYTDANKVDVTDIKGNNPVFTASSNYYQQVSYNTVASRSSSTFNSWFYVQTGLTSYKSLTFDSTGNDGSTSYTEWHSSSPTRYYRYYEGEAAKVQISTSKNSGFSDYSYKYFFIKNYKVIDDLSSPDTNAKYYVLKTTSKSYLQVYPHQVTITPAATVWQDEGGNVIPEPDKIYKLETDGQSTLPITATVQDTIDPRFEVVDEHGTPLTNGAEIGTDDFGGKGTLTVSASGPACIVWSSQSIPVEPGLWSQTIHVMAKPEFFGGNDIPTNVPGPDNSFVSYSVGGSDVKKEFNPPTVNVPILLHPTNLSETVFLGETVGAIPSSFDVAAFNDPTSSMWFGKGTTGTFTGQWYYDQACTQQGDSSAIPALTPSDTTPYYYKVTYTPNPNTDGSASESTHGGSAIGTTAVTDIYTVTVVKGALTITKTIAAPAAADAAQFFTFKIERYAYDAAALTGTPLSTSYEVIYGNGSKTINNLPRGKYKVTEIPNSAWRYKNLTETDTVYKLGQYLGRNGSTEAFTSAITAGLTNQLNNQKWISGKDSVTNRFTKAV